MPRQTISLRLFGDPDEFADIFDTKMALAGVPDVDIEEGVFKYVLIEVLDSRSNERKRIVRGYAFAEYHGRQNTQAAGLH
jgi:hypothetical protein